ncbi:DUF5627 domain-containing protein [Thermophagus sp. OGC60D27]|uniref:DUF5627 domain-containing protein n=1 Tax=Thermophagus sp. OGC60D27 TaxID=3458415 RepID=UPI0040380CF7
MRIFNLLVLVAILALFGCQNEDRNFPDYDTQTVYFPIQFPIRTLQLGESRFDNSIDKEHAFSIGVALSGTYNNSKNRVVAFEYAPDLLTQFDTLVAGGSDTLLRMPEDYYTLSSEEEFVIPAGEEKGTIRVDLAEAFFQDPVAVEGRYVIPLRILPDLTEDSVLHGVPVDGISNPDPLKPEEWGVQPKHFTLFAVKYHNGFHGSYLHRGVMEEYANGPGSEVVNTSVYHERYIVEDLVTSLSTMSLDEVMMNRLGNTQKEGYQMKLGIDENNQTVVISSVESGVIVNGSGSYANPEDAEADEWGGDSKRTFFLDYSFEDNGTYYHCTDTLVYRDSDMKYEEYSDVVMHDEDDE